MGPVSNAVDLCSYMTEVFYMNGKSLSLFLTLHVTDITRIKILSYAASPSRGTEW